MRALGFITMVLLVGTATAQAQQPIPYGPPPIAPGAAPPVGPGAAPPAQPFVPVAAPGASPLDKHLDNWERTMAAVVNFRVEIELTRTDAVFKRARNYKGVVLCMKPNFAILRLDNIGDPTKTDYEAVICNGRSVYLYNGVEKSVTEHKLPAPNPNQRAGTDNLMLDFLSGLKAAEAKRRFEITIFKEDENYVYLNLKPLLPQDKSEFQQINMALYGPNVKIKQLAYLPAQVLKVNPNGDTESWKFSDPKTNLPGIEARVFEYKEVPGFQYKLAPAQPQPQQLPPGVRPTQPTLPGGNGLPPGPGVVRP